MTIKITDYRKEENNSLKGKFDIKKTNSDGSYVKYSNFAHFAKEGKMWVNPPSQMINGKWERVIEFDPETAKKLLPQIVEELKKYLSNPSSANQEVDPFSL